MALRDGRRRGTLLEVDEERRDVVALQVGERRHAACVEEGGELVARLAVGRDRRRRLVLGAEVPFERIEVGGWDRMRGPDGGFVHLLVPRGADLNGTGYVLYYGGHKPQPGQITRIGCI